MKIYYFGCWGQIGHYLTCPDGSTPAERYGGSPWTALDGALCPGVGWRQRAGYPAFLEMPKDQPEGLAALHHQRGWTALAFWDRSVDIRGGSHSTFLAEGTHEFAAMVTLSKEHFPRIWARYRFEVRLAP